MDRRGDELKLRFTYVVEVGVRVSRASVEGVSLVPDLALKAYGEVVGEESATKSFFDKSPPVFFVKRRGRQAAFALEHLSSTFPQLRSGLVMKTEVRKKKKKKTPRKGRK